MSQRPNIVITLGDPCGIGPELLLRTLHIITSWCDATIVGSRIGLELLGPWPSLPVEWGWEKPFAVAPEEESPSLSSTLWTQDAASGQRGRALWIDPCPDVTAQQLTIGVGSAASGRCAVEAVRTGAHRVLRGAGDALVTLPLSKAAAHAAGYAIPGHTEFLQQLSGSPITRMAFVSPSLWVVLHTVHQSLRSVVAELSVDGVAETLTFAADRFMRLSGKLDLRVALCALNPHAGEGGAFGDEESILKEAIVQAEASFVEFRRAGDQTPFSHVRSPFIPGPAPKDWALFPNRVPMAEISDQREIEVFQPGSRSAKPHHPSPQFFGPLPSDTLFQRAAAGEFDLVVALYHDQGLIPIKVLEPKTAVNLTLGLPFIRTSPDHGTAFDKAGQWVGDPTNFLEATALAIRLAERTQAPKGNP
ncbi:MAG TPA: 4-hydroxythreonine-4-phosphate dehydrogenase PdxA [Holophaga sp.]|jgi:4-hydroxythreonine-4-phosphate dehydrogenase|nr:4-hydroxythreonine-4-phosphate dehydrogenase PdxA [Holophaga sp.]